MNNFTLSVQVPGEWGNHVRTIIIILIVVLASLGMESYVPLAL